MADLNESVSHSSMVFKRQEKIRRLEFCVTIKFLSIIWAWATCDLLWLQKQNCNRNQMTEVLIFPHAKQACACTHTHLLILSHHIFSESFLYDVILLFHCCTKYHNQNQLRGESALFQLVGYTPSLRKGRDGSDSSTARLIICYLWPATEVQQQSWKMLLTSWFSDRNILR